MSSKESLKYEPGVEIRPLSLISVSSSGPSNGILQESGEYRLDKNKPETFLNEDDLEKVTQSEVFPQKRLFSFFTSKKIPEVPDNDDERKTFPLFTANIISRIFIWWTLPMMALGYKRTIQPNDMFKMADNMSIEKLHKDFEMNLKFYFDKGRSEYLKTHPDASPDELRKNVKLPKLSVPKALFFTFKYQYSWAIFCAVAGTCCSALTPLITKRLIEFVERKAFFPHLHVNVGVGYAIGSCLMMILSSILFNHFFLSSHLTGVQAKAVLTTAAFNKMFKLTDYSKHKFPVGKVTSFVTTDLARIEFALIFQPLLAGFFPVLAISLVQLIVNLGAIGLVGIGVFFFLLIFALSMFSFLIKLRKTANIFTDARVTKMREILNSMKVVKFYAWEDAYEANIQEIRSNEVKTVKKMQLIKNFVIALAASVPNIASFVTFTALFKINGSNKNPGNIFSSLSVFQIFSLQMFFLPIAVGTGVDMMIGLGRLQKLLEAEEIQDTSIEIEYNEIPIEKDDCAIKVINGSFEWQDYEKLDAAELKMNEEEKVEEKKSKFWKKNKKTEKEVKLVHLTSTSINANDATEEKKKSFKGFNNLNFEIKKGELVIVTGPIGTGKTSLLNAISGSMNILSGDVKVNGTMLMGGYPWIQNATIRDNILFGSPFVKEKYQEVIRVCSLDSDIELFEFGDKTEIGERGITLSGGQKARLSLARCIYKEKDIYLFDDILSAVDAKVGRHIMDTCILGYLKDKTIILATHQLSLINKASTLIVLDNDGNVDVGTVKQLKATNQTLIQLLDCSSHSKSSEEEEAEIEAAAQAELETEKALNAAPPRSENSDVQGFLNKEERAVNHIKFDVYKDYVKAGTGKWLIPVIIVYGFSILAYTFCSIFASVWLSYWTENKFKNRGTSFYMGLYAFFIFGDWMFLTLQFTILCVVGIIASKWLNLNALHRVLHTPMSFMDTTPLGRILNRFTKDTDCLDNEITDNLRLLVTQASSIVGVVVLCIVYLPWFAIAIPFLLLFLVVIADVYQSTGREVKRLEAVQRSFVYNNFNEVLGGMETVKAFNSQDRFLLKSNYLINKMNEASFLLIALQRWVAIFMDLVATAFAFIIAMLCVTRQFKISPAAVGVLLTYTLQIPGLLNNFLRAYTQAENDMNSAERLVQYASTLPTEVGYKLPEMLPPSDWPQNGKIEFQSVDFAYRKGLPIVLKKFSLDINSTEKIGICGRTGAGKSTIMNALYRLNELDGGKIIIDGIDIANIGLFDLRRNLSIIPQDPALFKGTIRKNLDPFNQCTDDELWTSLIKSGVIKIEELSDIKLQEPDCEGSFSKMHKFHLNQQVEEEGSNFSLGERQLLALARALARNSKILILDEATSSVDYETDKNIQLRIGQYFNDCTILCIAHRLNTIIKYDKILVLDSGTIAEFDTPYNLYRKKDGVFRSMCEKSCIKDEDFH